MSADSYSLVSAARLRERRASSPDSDPNELKRRERARRDADDAERDERLEQLEHAVSEIKTTIVEFKAMVRAWLLAVTAFWTLTMAIIGLVTKFGAGH